MKRIAILLAIIMALSTSLSVWADAYEDANNGEIANNEALDEPSASINNDMVENNDVTEEEAIIEENKDIDTTTSSDDVISDENENNVFENVVDEAVSGSAVNIPIDNEFLPLALSSSAEYLNNSQWDGKFDDLINGSFPPDDEPVIYNINFYIDGELWAYGSVAKRHSEDEVAIPSVTVPNKEDFDFNGWYLSSDGMDLSNYYDNAYSIYKDTDLYGYYSPKNTYPVFIALNDGSGAMYKEKIYANEKGIVSMPSQLPSSMGRVFKGYSTDIDGNFMLSVKDFSDFDKFSSFTTNEPTVVYCQWDLIQYNVKYYMNDGTDSIYETKTGNIVIGAETPMENPTREGYTFDGWYADNHGGIPFISSNPVSSDMNVYANWNIINYPVTFYLNDGTASVYEKGTGNINGFSIPSKAPTRDEYVFDGWYYDMSCTDKVDSNATRPVKSSLSIYAKWTPAGEAELSISKSVDKKSVRSGDTLTYTITVTNNGTANAKNVVVEDVLASNLTYVSSTNGSCSGNKFTWTIAEIAKDSNATVDIVVKLK